MKSIVVVEDNAAIRKLFCTNLKTKTLITVFITMLFFVACRDNYYYDDTLYNNDPFTFLKVGNEWEYGIYNNDELINTTNLKIISASDGSLINYRVIFDNDENKFAYWVYHNGMRSADMELVPYYIGFHSDSNAIFNHLAYSLQQDCYVGKQWNINYGNEPIKILQETLSISDTLITPAGIFYNCIKVKTSPLFGSFDNYTWFNKNYGIIMMQEGGVTYKLNSKNFNW